MANELRNGFRMLSKNPGLALVAIAALALGIATTTTAFSAFNALFLRPTPLMPDQERIVYISESVAKPTPQNVGVSYPDFLEWKSQATTLEGVAAIRWANFIVSDRERPERHAGAYISAEAFRFLRVPPIVGRGFRAEEDDLNAAPVALISYKLWQNQFGASRAIIGREISINSKPATIVGVMPRGWHFPDFQDIWMPLQLDEKDHSRSEFPLQVVGKLRNGVSLAAARAELEAVNARLALQYPDTNAGRGVAMTSLREQLSGGLRQPMLLVLGAVVVVQLIACGNLANLLLARGATRAQELAVRHALGASRAQIVRHLLGESFVIGLAGSACGILLTAWGLNIMRATFPTELPYWVRFDFDWRICLCAIVTGLVSTLLFGAFPAFRCSRPDLLTDLKRSGGSTPGCGKTERTRNYLVVAQIALTMVLLIGASLMLRSLLKLQSIAIGVDPSNTLTFRIGLPQPEFPTAATQARFFEQLNSELAAMPGVEAAGATNALPGTGASRRSVFVEGAAGAGEPQEARAINAVTITPEFLRAARIPLLRGRDFTPADNENAARVAIIDEEAARLWFPDQDPIGRRVAAMPKPNEPPQWATIVAVAGKVAYDVSLRQRPHPAIYFPHAQSPQPFMAVALRTKTDATALVTSAREVVLSAHKGVPIHAVETMDEVLARALWRQKFFGALFAVFATVAVLLAAIGLYGLIAYAARQRTREIGVRVALGAGRRDVFRLITGYGLRLIALGLVIGSVAAFFLSPLLAPNLHGILPHDLVSFTAVPVLLLTIGLLACYLPAKAATRLSPIEALRHE